MRIHLQGTFLLIVILLAFWGALNWAGSILDSALGDEDGAIVARARIESDDPVDAAAVEQDEPLDGNEVAELQAALIRLGYSPGPVDGILGELTREAITESKADLGIATASHRRLFETLGAALDALNSAAADSEN